MSSRLVEPVSRNRPGRLGRSSSTAPFTARRTSGSLWTSSRVSSGALRTRSEGAVRACSSTSKSSSVTYERRSARGSIRASVLFPVWRAPMSTTTGIVASARSTRVSAVRGNNECMGLHLDLRKAPSSWANIANDTGDFYISEVPGASWPGSGSPSGARSGRLPLGGWTGRRQALAPSPLPKPKSCSCGPERSYTTGESHAAIDTNRSRR